MAPRGLRFDGLLAAVLAAISVFSVLTPAHSQEYDFPPPNAALIALTVLAAAVLAVRRRWPLPVCLAVALAVFPIGAAGWNAGSTPFLVLIAVYTVAAERPAGVALGGLGAVGAGVAVLVLLQAPYFEGAGSLLFVVVVAAAFALGRWMRRRRAHHADARTRAVDAERARAAEAQRAVLTERLSLARELHDVVSHTLSVITVQAGSTRHRLQHSGADGEDFDRAVAALSAIETSGRLALDDLRRMLGVLRADPPGDEPGSGGSPRTPAAGSPRSGIREGLVDGIAAAVLAALGLALALSGGDPSHVHRYPGADGRLVVLVLLACLPLAVRRRWPVPVFVVSLAATLTIINAGFDPDMAALATYVALYSVAAWRPLPLAAAALAAWVAGDLVFWLAPVPNYDPFADLGGADVLIPFVLGLAVRRWRQDADAALARALEVERTTAAAAEQAAYAERLRIAAELHDVVTHTLSAVAVQAAVLRHHLGDRAGPELAALTTIEEAGRGALHDLRRMVGVLGDPTGGTDQAASLTPTPGLDELELLASAHRATHGPVDLSVDPLARTAPDSVQLTAFRLVQEGLTNVRKHARGAAASVRVAAVDGRIVVAIENDGLRMAGPSRRAIGFGLAGMRERAALFGGTVEAGPVPEGGFRVEVTLPVPARHAVPA
jgi:signal transduction histidine kinase